MLTRVFYAFKVFGKKFLIAIDKTVKLFSVFICQNSPVFRVGHGILVFCSQQWGVSRVTEHKFSIDRRR